MFYEKVGANAALLIKSSGIAYLLSVGRKKETKVLRKNLKQFSSHYFQIKILTHLTQARHLI